MVQLKMITMANFMLYMLYHHFIEMGKKFVVVTWEIDWKGEENNQGMHLRWRRDLIKFQFCFSVTLSTEKCIA